MSKMVNSIIVILFFSHLCAGAVSTSIMSDISQNQGKFTNSKKSVINLPFIENKGQFGKEVLFYTQIIEGTVYITKNNEIMYSFRSQGDNEVANNVFFSEVFINGQDYSTQGLVHAVTKVNYFKGVDPSLWTINIPTYESLDLGEIYKGVNVKLKAHDNNVEKVFVIKSGTDPNVIRMKLTNTKHLAISETGELEIFGQNESVSFTRPIAYQEIGDKIEYVDVAYSIRGNQYGFDLGDYNQNYPLIIDPLLNSTYYGGTGKDGLLETPMAMDAEGNIYVASRTQSNTDLPLIIPGAYQETWGGGSNDVFIAKFNNNLSVLLAATYLGGSSEDGIWPGLDLKIDPSGNIIVTGRTYSSDFPTTSGVIYPSRIGNYDVFISKLSPDLDVLLASTYLGGTSAEYYIKSAVADNGDIYVAGTTASPTNFPITVGAYDPDFNGMGSGPYPGDLFVSKINNDLTTLLASTYLGGSYLEYCEELLLGEDGNVFLVGWTSSSNFPTSTGAYDVSMNGGTYDVFVTCLSGDLTALVASTFLGGSGLDIGYAMTLNENGDVYVTGHTSSSHTYSTPFPTTTGAYQETYQGGGSNTDDAFVAKFNHELTSLLACTYYGGPGFENGTGLKIGRNGKVYLGGPTTSSNLEIYENTFDSTYAGGSLYSGDAFVTVFDTDLTKNYAFSYIGGSGSESLGSMLLDDFGDIYISGSTNSSNLPTTENAYQENFAGGGEGAWLSGDDWGGDIFISKFNFDRFTRITEGPHVTDGGHTWGVNWIDHDNDGYLDLFVTNIDIDNGLYHNNGDGTFTKIIGEDLTVNSAGISSAGASWADFNNDGFPDVSIATYRESSPPVNTAFINNGDGSFTKVTGDPIVSDAGMSIDPSWVDYNNDGLLDLYVANHGINYLYQQQEEGGFVKITSSAIATTNNGSNSASWGDNNNDGYQDLFVTNGWITPNDCLYENNGDGSFTKILSGSPTNSPGISVGGSWGDYDDDGYVDLFVTQYVWNSPGISFDSLFHNNGDGTFTSPPGIAPNLNGAYSNGATWGDFNNDGDLDLYVAVSGENLMYENQGDGTFERITDGVIVTDDNNSLGCAAGDYDRDGDLDLFVTNVLEDNTLYQNNGNNNNWINIKCEGIISNRSAIGTRVYLKATIGGTAKWQNRHISGKTGKSTQNSLNVHFGLGDADIIDSIKIEWPGGQITDILTNVPVNQFLTVTESVCGDIDGVPGISILDVVYLINFRYKSGPPPVPYYAADVNSDDDVGILDVVYIVNFKYKNGPAPDCP